MLSWRSQFAQVRYVPRALRLVWLAAPGWTLASTALLVVQGVLPVFTVYLTRSLVNALVAVVSSGADRATLAPALLSIVLMGLVMASTEVLGSIAAYVETLLSDRTQDFMQRMIQTKAITLDLRFFDSPEYYDQLRRASVDAVDRPLGLLSSLGDLLQNTITLAAMAGVLMSFVWWMPLVLLIGTAPALWVALRTTWHFHQWRQRNTLNQRQLFYYQHVLTVNDAAAEVRLFDLGRHFIAAYRHLRNQVRQERLDLARQQMVSQIVAGLIGLVSVAAALAWMAWQAIQGLFNLGDLAMFWQAMNQGQRLMRGLLTGVGEIYRNLLFLEDLFVFLDLEPLLRDPVEPAAPPDGLRDGIRLEQVTFRYPGSERIALDAFDLAIPAQQIVAIVGENGAGKSTLIKLLCRFYDPDAGRVTWDGVDLRQMAQADLRRRITVLFQQHLSFHVSAADNIAFGDLAAHPDRAKVEKAAASAGAASVIDKLPEGYDTILGRWFGHAELSIGEWQRLALARAFVREADFVVLDEPTSAMDSWAEVAWMGRFRELVAGRTALIITHRFTTAMQADVIHVMDQGSVVESGTHDELVALGGRYAQSWRLQMREVKAVTPTNGDGPTNDELIPCPH